MALLAALVGVCCAALLIPRGQSGSVAVIRQDGRELARVELARLEEPWQLRVEGENGLYNQVTAERGRICVSHAGCPDQVCVRQGWISDSSVPVVCLPNRLLIEIVGEERELDAMVK